MYLFASAVLIVILGLPGAAQARTRDAVVNEARSMRTISAWTATNNTAQFGQFMFMSKYPTGVQEFDWPYVFGGKETPDTTSNRINNQVSPGGVNVSTSTPLLSTGDLWQAGLNPALKLAGIDCSGFAVGALFGRNQIPSYAGTNANGLASMSLPINQASVEPGDLLVTFQPPGYTEPGGHVEVVITANPLTFMDAHGGSVGKVREPTPDPAIGGLPYAFYSPFPKLLSSLPVVDGRPCRLFGRSFGSGSFKPAQDDQGCPPVGGHRSRPGLTFRHCGAGFWIFEDNPHLSRRLQRLVYSQSCA